MNQIAELDAQDIKDFGIMCKVFGVFWRKCNLNAALNNHVVESHLIDTMYGFRRVGLFNENPIERVHLENKNWAGVLTSFKRWENRVDFEKYKIKCAHDKRSPFALDEYSDFGMTKSKSSQDDSRSTYRLYGELMNEIDIFKRDSSDVDDQLVDNMSVHNMEGFEEVDPIEDDDAL